MSIVIKKRIPLEFLGEDYKDSYLVFKSIPLKDFEPLLAAINGAENDNLKSLGVIVKILDDYFLEGQFEGQAVTKEDLKDLDQQTALTVFEELTGQLSPKGEASSQTQSETAQAPES